MRGQREKKSKKNFIVAESCRTEGCDDRGRKISWGEEKITGKILTRAEIGVDSLAPPHGGTRERRLAGRPLPEGSKLAGRSKAARRKEVPRGAGGGEVFQEGTASGAPSGPGIRTEGRPGPATARGQTKSEEGRPGAGKRMEKVVTRAASGPEGCEACSGKVSAARAGIFERRSPLVQQVDSELIFLFFGEFDSGSERTLAAWIRHASRTGRQ